MSCKKYMAEIEEGAAGANLSSAARLHLEACAACRTFERERASLRALVGSLAGVAAPADFEFRLRARMRSERAAPRRSLFGGAFAPAAGVALAACLVAAVAASLYVGQRRAGDETVARIADSQTQNQQTRAAAPAANEAAAAQSLAAVSQEGQALASLGEGDDVEAKGAKQRSASRQLASVAERSRTIEGVERRTVSFNVSRAAVVSNPSAGEVALTGPTVALPLPKSEQQLKVLMRDSRGASRVVPVRNVSFGSEGLVARAGTQRADASAKEVAW